MSVLVDLKVVPCQIPDEVAGCVVDDSVDLDHADFRLERGSRQTSRSGRGALLCSLPAK